MYRAHSKDINRNKSFHPLTYGNLRRVEVLKEKEEEKSQQAADRLKELHRDQEERRYDELVLTNSADSLSGELARFRQTKNIFKAEYEVESARQQKRENEPGSASPSPSASTLPVNGASGSPSNSFLSKFKKEGEGGFVKEEVKAEPSDASSAADTVAPNKRPREGEESEGDGPKNSGPTTGFVTSAEAAQLRKELNLAQKQRHDPLMRVRQYQNSCVASAARQQQQQQQSVTASEQQGPQRDVEKSAKGGNNDALQSRIRELLELKKRKK